MIRCSAPSGQGWRRCDARARVPRVVETPTNCVGVGGARLMAHTLGGSDCACTTNLDLMPMGPAVTLFVPGRFARAPMGRMRARYCRCWGWWSCRWCHHHWWIGPPHWGLAEVGMRLAGGKNAHNCCLNVLESLRKLSVGWDKIVHHHVLLDQRIGQVVQ
jgi:hypothetical protein